MIRNWQDPIITVTLVSLLLSCQKPDEQDVLVGEWKFSYSIDEVYLKSEVSQTILIPFVESGTGLPISGKYSAELLSLLIAYDESTDSRLLLLHSGRAWIGGEHQFSILETPDTIMCQYLYNPSEEYFPDSTELFTPQSIDYDFNFTTGVFQINNCILFSDTDTGQIVISGAISFPTIFAQENEPVLFLSSHSAKQSEDIEVIALESDGTACVTHLGNSMYQDECGEWTTSSTIWSLNLTEANDDYTIDVVNDSLILSQLEGCEDAYDGENLLWISEFPSALSTACFYTNSYFGRE